VGGVNLDSSAAWLDLMLETSNGERVTFRDGALVVPNLTAVIGVTPIGFDLGGGVLQSWQITDFFLAADDLTDGAEEITPAVGQIFTRLIGGREVEYQVCNTDAGRCYRHPDPSWRTLQIHTKQSSEA